MNVLIIYCHPSKESYTHQVLKQLQQSMTERNWSIEISDLYDMNFHSDMTREEYERETSKIDLPVSMDVSHEHEKIKRADCVIFLYPVWWSDCPAKLKGWFDRVLSVGFAYKKKDERSGMPTIKHGIAVCTAGYTNKYLEEIGIAQSMENVMLNDRFGKRFEHKKMIILGGTLDLEAVKAEHQKEIDNMVIEIAG